MQIEDISCTYLKKLYNAASQLVLGNEPQLMLEMVHQIQQESFSEGFKYAIEVLKDILKENIERKV